MQRNTKFLFIFFIGCAAAAGAIWGYQAQIANADLTQQEVNDYIEEYLEDHPIEICHKDADCVRWLNDNYVSESQLRFEIDSIDLEHTHDQFAKYDSSLEGVAKDITSLKIDVAKLKQGNPTGGDQGGITVTTDRSSYEAGDVVIFSGTATPNRQLTSEIYLQTADPENALTKRYTPTTNVPEDGRYYLYWATPSNIETGVYKADLRDAAGKTASTTVRITS